MQFNYDVIVVGAGHAGCEAAHAAARMGVQTLLITMDLEKVAQMSCNPAVGGIAKGQIVREIDAMGGMMGIVTDTTSIQFRILNRSKGPAMWSPRAQSDRAKFSRKWREILENTPNLYLWQDSVSELLFTPGNKAVCGVRTNLGAEFSAKAVVLTNGTFLNGLMHIGRTMFPGGRISEPASTGLTEQLRTIGFSAMRMKTGTPVRIDGRSVDWKYTEVQPLEDDFHHFSFLPEAHSTLTQRPCYIVSTSEKTHDVLRRGLPDSPLYNGQIQSIGPRYCPSIETKIVTFADKTEHQLFLEPEGETTQEFYLNGFSSSLPMDIQIEALQTIPAFENVQIYRPGYAIEYDFFDPTQLRHTLETKLVQNLFFAGQINGTTGYEEAAGQGLVAGANAAINVLNMQSEEVQKRPPLILNRDQAYIGVLIDDLVTKGVDEPYRMFTSRAEYRILLRQDNADVRLTPLAYELGLADSHRYQLLQEKIALRDQLMEFINNFHVKINVGNALIDQINTLELQGTKTPLLSPLTEGCRLVALLLRPQLSIDILRRYLPALEEHLRNIPDDRRSEIIEAAEILIKYEGYIKREQQIADKIQRLENVTLGDKFNYAEITSLSTEARQKLERIRPATVAQASRIPGVSPADINILLLLSNR